MLLVYVHTLFNDLLHRNVSALINSKLQLERFLVPVSVF